MKNYYSCAMAILKGLIISADEFIDYHTENITKEEVKKFEIELVKEIKEYCENYLKRNGKWKT